MINQRVTLHKIAEITFYYLKRLKTFTIIMTFLDVAKAHTKINAEQLVILVELSVSPSTKF